MPSKKKSILGLLGTNPEILGVFGVVTIVGLCATIYFGFFPTAAPPPQEPSPVDQAWEELLQTTFFVEPLRIGVSQDIDIEKEISALRDHITCKIGPLPAFVGRANQNGCDFSFTGQFRALDAPASDNAPELGVERDSSVALTVCRKYGAKDCHDGTILLTFENRVRDYVDLSHASTPSDWPRGTQAEISILLDSRPIETPLRCKFPRYHAQGDVAFVEQTGQCRAVLKNIKADGATRYGIDLLDQYGRTLDTYILKR